MTAATPDKVVILAAGRGMRLRAAADTPLSPAQAAAADAGVKALVPVGRPFLDYVLHEVASAGLSHVCLVVGPDHDALRRRYGEELRPRRLTLTFAIQPEQRGTADAVLAAEAFTAGDPFLLLNSDNHYPAATLAALRALPGPGVAAFDRTVLATRAGIPAERLAGYAIIEADAAGQLRRIIEKPDAATLARLPDAGIGMNCWRLPPSILAAARCIQPSPRGELELTDAVQCAIDQLGERFQVVQSADPVLDLSRRADIPPIAEYLSGWECDL